MELIVHMEVGIVYMDFFPNAYLLFFMYMHGHIHGSSVMCMDLHVLGIDPALIKHEAWLWLQAWFSKSGKVGELCCRCTAKGSGPVIFNGCWVFFGS